jgi:chitin disaccharide deacetylase
MAIPRMDTLLVCLAMLVTGGGTGGAVGQSHSPSAQDGVYLLIRSDDAGMTHAVNRATRRLLETGLPVSVSIMFPTPWYQEIVEILREHPETSVGVHLTLNSEWRHYRWGPVIGREAAPSLVDEHGHFFHSAQLLYDNDPDLGEVERELRAQIERALGTGLRIDYLDFHMGTARRHPDFRTIVERLGSEYGLGLSGYVGERMHDPQYRADPEAKADSLVAMVARLEPGYHVVITHPGLDTPEMAALVDLNVHHPLENMSAHRQGELDALTSEAFADAIRRHGVTLITYKDLLERERSIEEASPSQ